MNAIEIFKQLIGKKLTPLIVKYDPYKDVFTTHPYRHIFDDNFEILKERLRMLFSIVSYFMLMKKTK